MNEEIKLTASKFIETRSPLPLSIPILHLFFGRGDIVEEGLVETYTDPKNGDLVFVYEEAK